MTKGEHTMTVILDPELEALIAQDPTVAVLWQEETAGRTGLLAKAADCKRTSQPVSCPC